MELPKNQMSSWYSIFDLFHRHRHLAERALSIASGSPHVVAARGAAPTRDLAPGRSQAVNLAATATPSARPMLLTTARPQVSRRRRGSVV